MTKIKLDIYNLSTPELITCLNAIVSKMTGNATFSTLAAKTTALGTAVTALQTANTDYDASVATTSGKLSARDAARQVAEDAARVLASGAEGVTRVAADLEGGGWTLAGTASPVGMLPQVGNVCATGGDLEGEVDLTWDPIRRGLQSYLVEYALPPSGPWTQCYVGQASKCTCSGLTSGTEYWFRVRGVGAAGPGPWSDRASKRADAPSRYSSRYFIRSLRV